MGKHSFDSFLVHGGYLSMGFMLFLGLLVFEILCPPLHTI